METDKFNYNWFWQNVIVPKVLERDKYTCQKCKKNLTEIQLEVHHEDYDNQTFMTLITLCTKCHKAEHKKT